MNNLVETHLRQARSLMLAGEPEKAVALLEKARALAAREPQVLVAVLKDLSTACKLAGRLDDSSNYFMELQDLAPTADVGHLRHPRITKSLARRLMPAWIGVTCLVIALGSGLMWRFARSIASTVNSLSSNSGTPLTNMPIDPSASEKLMYSDVGLVVVMAEYVGSINDTSFQMDVPIATGSCFAFDSRGYLLTNKHVVDAANDAPATMEKSPFYPNPDMKLIQTYYLACFGPAVTDHLKAELFHKNERIDMAILHVNRTFDHPMEFVNESPHAKNDVYAEGYPGDVQDFLIGKNFDQKQYNDKVQAAIPSGHLNWLDCVFSSEAFRPQINHGMVSAGARQIEGVTYVEHDALTGHGNSGGPLLNAHDQVVGMVTLGLGGIDPADNGQNFAISISELRKELQLFLK